MSAGFIPKLSSHGNAKTAKPFHPTWPSTLNRIKSESSTKGPRATIEQVSSEIGGILGASAPGELPSNELQVSNKRRKGKKVGEASVSAVTDDLFWIMQQAHTQDPEHTFVRDIKTAPEPAVVLASDQQLNNLVRFGTSPQEFGVITIDPTFSLGEFDVTPLTYRHILLVTRRSNQSPIFLGPLLIHYKKTFSTYLFFASSLIGLRPYLEGMRAFGTDGEVALFKAFSHEFGFSQHLTCFIHVRRNIKDKLNECSVPSVLVKQVLDDIFGHRFGDVFEEGLVDSRDNDDFQIKLSSLLVKWSSFESTSSTDMDSFLNWFKTNKVGVIRNTMTRSIREECGLGNPPDIFTTNPSESINALLKHKMNYKKSELPTFIEKVKELSREQVKEVERAIINRGKYQLKDEYKFLEIPESKWFNMNLTQRKNHLAKVHSLAVMSLSDSENYREPDVDQCHAPTATQLAVSVESVANALNLPLTCVQSIWRKAAELINDKNAIFPAPGQNEEARMVLSYSGKTPHLVTPSKGGGFACDGNCPNWKSIAFCSHSIAVAQLNGMLPQFISFLKKKKVAPNVTKLVTSGMPRGRGRKCGVPPRKRRQVEAPSVRLPMNTDLESNIEGNVATSHQPSSSYTGYYCSPPPAYSSYQMQFPGMLPSPSPACNPYKLSFIRGNISVCIGCNNRYAKSPKAPDDLCIKHQEWREFTPHGSETPQSKYTNVYYHCKPECVWHRNPYFRPEELQIEDIISQLKPEHKSLLAAFGIDSN